jgi:hypothetical protein
MMAKLEPLFKEMFPDLNVPYKDLYQILLYLEETQVNPEIIAPMIRGVHNINIGTGLGDVIIHVDTNKGVTNVHIREQYMVVMTKVASPVEKQLQQGD